MAAVDLVRRLIAHPPRRLSQRVAAGHEDGQPRNILTQLAEWTRFGFLTRIGPGTYALASHTAVTAGQSRQSWAAPTLDRMRPADPGHLLGKPIGTYQVGQGRLAAEFPSLFEKPKLLLNRVWRTIAFDGPVNCQMAYLPPGPFFLLWSFV